MKTTTTKEQQFQADIYEQLKMKLKRIETKCENLNCQIKDTWAGDLGHVLNQLNEIDSFLNDKYLTK